MAKKTDPIAKAPDQKDAEVQARAHASLSGKDR